jgi:hypothetical protein
MTTIMMPLVTLLLEVRNPESLVHHRALLVENHPGHDHRTDVGRQEGDIGAVAERQCRQAVDELVDVRMAHQHRRNEHQLRQSDRHPDPLDPPVSAAERQPDEIGGRGWNGYPLRDPEQLPHRGDTENSVKSAPTAETSRVVAERSAQRGPNRSRISWPWPFPVTIPSRTVISWAM